MVCATMALIIKEYWQSLSTYILPKIIWGLCIYNPIGCVILPKVLRNIGTRQFPIPLDPKTSPSEKNSKHFQIYYPTKPVEVLLYDLLIAILVQSLRLKKIYEGVGLHT